jgi:hypothetical protein
MIKSSIKRAKRVHALERLETCTNFFAENPERKISLRRSRRRWKDNIKINSMETGSETGLNSSGSG